MSFLDNKKILIFGPANKFDENSDLSYFNNYDLIIINNKMIQLLQPNLKKIKNKKFRIILLLNGVFTNGNPETIKKYDKKVLLYFVSETCLAGNLMKLDIDNKKIVSMANNYSKFNFKGCPNMIPKLIMLLIDHKVNFKLLEISGLTLYMKLSNNEEKLNSYHPDYHNWETKLPKDKLNLSNDEKLLYHVNGISNNSKDSLDHGIIENFTFFLKYYKNYQEKIKVDDILQNIINDNINLLDQ
jgi:hypothetical protein|uniref:Uncharacterized protein n=1 Tax=viral metagenome TaxID=1070528 RepID=A0A6C0IT29_9ZZZZ